MSGKEKRVYTFDIEFDTLMDAKESRRPFVNVQGNCFNRRFDKIL